MSDTSETQPSEKSHSRRRFLKLATLALGGAVGVVTAIPLLRYFLHPLGRKVVSNPDAPIDAVGLDELVPGAPPIRVQLRVSRVRDAWNVADEVALGSAWVSKDSGGEVRALSAVCPHLGCAIDFNEQADTFQCPCHKSEFTREGSKQSGPSKRGLDPLPVIVEDNRVKISFRRFRPDIADRVEV